MRIHFHDRASFIRAAMWFIHNPLRHLEAIRHWADAADAQVQLSARSWMLTVSQGAASCLLQPR
ncbi:MAG TPA: hypothetical protein VLJ57_17085, partial [Burkholderiaceae bacterium]|nr:hypothetical protein [Burkholderiaceae bacterium]